MLQLFLHWIVTVIVLLAPPAGPAYNFIVNLYVYKPLFRSFLTIQVHISRRVDQRLRHSWSHLPPIQKVGELVVPLAHLPPHLGHLHSRQHLPRPCSLHST